MSAPKIQFIDLAAQQRRIRPAIDAGIQRVLDHGKYIMGPEVQEFERDLCDFSGAKNAISCSNGTDALLMILMAKGIGPGDAVICPDFTFTATPEVIALLGATPVFCDVDDVTFNLDPDQLPAAVSAARAAGLVPRAVIAVDLFGLPAEYERIEQFAAEQDMWVLSDCAQGFGSSYGNRMAGQFGDATATSFFPAKPLGCYGDGGAVFTDDDELADVMRSIRVHGKGTDKYDNVRVGQNARLDTMQAAILIEKLKIFPDEIVARNAIAKRYEAGLSSIDGLVVPHVPEGSVSVWAQYTLRVDAGRRDSLAASLGEAGVPTAIYYPKPLHQQTAYEGYPCQEGGVPVSSRLAKEVLSLPMHPYLGESDQDYIIEQVRKFA